MDQVSTGRSRDPGPYDLKTVEPQDCRVKPCLAYVAPFVLAEAKALDSAAMSHVGATRTATHSATAEFVRDAVPPARGEDDEDIDLPEFIVGDDDAEDEEGADKFDDALPDLRDDGGDPLDDTNASDLDVGIHIEDDDAREGNAEQTDELVDVGALDDDFAQLDSEGSALDPDRESDGFVEDEDVGGMDLASSDDDGGSEGTGEDVADDIDENALPELDESENDHADESLADVLLEEATRAQLPSWASSRFVPLEGAGASVPCIAVFVAAGRVFAAGDVVLLVDEGAHAARTMGLDAPSLAIAAMEGLTVIATTRGGLLASRDGWMSASAVTGFRSTPSTKGSVGLACTLGRIWILHDRALWSMADADIALVRVRENGMGAIGATTGALVALATRNDGVFVEKFRGDDEPWQSTALPDEVAKFVAAEHRPTLVATAGGKRLAIASQRGLYLSNNGGVSFLRVELPGVSSACFAGEDETADLLVVVTSPDEPLAHLIRVTDDGETARLADVLGSTDNNSFGDVSIAWDASRELVWIASRHGLVAYGPARRH